MTETVLFVGGSTKWLCGDCYRRACDISGVIDLEVCTIANYFNAKCVICGEIAKHLTCFSDNLIPILIEEYRKEMNRMVEDTMKQVRERHVREIEDFQNNCLHTFVSEWMPYMWAPGHYSNDVKACVRCEKVMETRSFR